MRTSLLKPRGESAYLLQTFSVIRRERLSPSFLRITFRHEGDSRLAFWGPDQRVKIFFPPAGTAVPSLPESDWNIAWSALPDERRPARRSYTIRNLRTRTGEMDVDFVAHGEEGPASAWALRCRSGDHVQIACPNADFLGKPAGFEWRPPRNVTRILMMGDETAVPAISNILTRIDHRAVAVDCFVEVPHAGDDAAAGEVAPLITWLPREGSAPGAQLKQALSYTGFPELAPLTQLHQLDKSVRPDERMWDPASRSSGPFYAWIAGEGASVKFIRHALLKDCGLSRTAVSSMGYWYLGRPFH